jgi:hypothetical protein
MRENFMKKPHALLIGLIIAHHSAGASSEPESFQGSLLNEKYIENFIIHEAPWRESHGSIHGTFLGAGLLYYTLAYITHAQVCVCLGSGGGFVPRIMRQAQRDLALAGSRTILIDANIGDYGRPQWLSEECFFKKQFPDIEIIMDTTHNTALTVGKDWKINYLHIDADHSLEGAYQDFIDYLPLMAPKGVITFHDTRDHHMPCAQLIPMLQEKGYEIINFQWIGEGTAVLYLP